jgi:hypothetical protein
MTDLHFCASLALCALLITSAGDVAASGTIGNPEVKARWVSSSPPPVAVVSATVRPCGRSLSLMRLATDTILVEDAVIGPIPTGDWCDLRLIVEGDDGARQLLVLDIQSLDAAEALLWLDGEAVGELVAELEPLGG